MSTQTLKKTKTLLIIGGGKEALSGIQETQNMGLRVLVSDRDINAPGVLLADDFIQASVYDPQETLLAVLAYPNYSEIDGVLAIACDATTTVSTVTNALHLPGHSLETAQLATDKLLMKQRFQQCGIPIPWFSEVRGAEHLKQIVQESLHPLVLKPVDSRGSRGVLRITPAMQSSDLEWAFTYALSHSPKRRLLVERWIDGPQLSTESVIWDDESVLVAVADRNYDRLDEFAPFIIEDGGTTPSHLSPKINPQLNDLLARTAKAIGVTRGTIKGDIVIGNEGPVVIEIAARLSGGYFCTHTIPRVYNVNIINAAVRIALGQKPDIRSLLAFPTCYQGNRYLFLQEGTVKSIRHVEKAANHQNVGLFGLYVKEGDHIPKTTDHTKRCGIVMTFAESREQAVTSAEQAIKALEVLVE